VATNEVAEVDSTALPTTGSYELQIVEGQQDSVFVNESSTKDISRKFSSYNIRGAHAENKM